MYCTCIQPFHRLVKGAITVKRDDVVDTARGTSIRPDGSKSAVEVQGAGIPRTQRRVRKSQNLLDSNDRKTRVSSMPALQTPKMITQIFSLLFFIIFSGFNRTTDSTHGPSNDQRAYDRKQNYGADD